MNNVITALGILNSLLTLGTNAYVQAQKVSNMINTAIQEGRDLNDEELTSIWTDRQAAVQRWYALTDDETQ